LLSVGWVSVITLVLAILWLALIERARREYVTAFRAGLKSGTLQPDATIDPRDVTTLTTLVQGLGSPDPRRVLHSMQLLSESGEGRLVPPVMLHHDDPRVRLKALDVLRRAGRDDAAPLVERAVQDDDAGVRTTAMQTLAALRGEQAATVALELLDDDDPRLRTSAAVSLLAKPNGVDLDRVEGVLGELSSSDDPAVREETARALGQVPDPTASDLLIQLLYDRDLAVVRAAIAAVAHRFEHGGPNPLYATILISLMGNRRLKLEARDALVAQGSAAIPPLLHFMRSPDEQIWVRRAVPKTIALIGVQEGAEALVESLDASDHIVRSKIVEALVFMRTHGPTTSFKRREITRQVQLEARRYLRLLADLWAVSSMYEARLVGPLAVWAKDGRVPTLPQQLLAQRMSRTVGNIFGLLELIEDPDDVRAARRSLLSSDARLRGRALEYLDNALSGAVRRYVFAVIDDAPPPAKLERARELFDIRSEGPETTLERLIRIDPREDPSAIGIVLAALYNVWAEQIDALYPLVDEIAESAIDPMVRETAQWVRGRVESGPRARGVLAKGGESDMAPMAQIEMMVFLQGVDLFANCNAEEVLRLAAIAGEESYAKDQVIYRRDETADKLYCVVEGRVRLEADGERRAVIGASGRFGVFDILSGRPRLSDAVATTETRLLMIEAEDFFDLLSNNIEIVRALFASVVSLSDGANERLL
jgi:HEAT repeat protein